jgi:AAHS family 4-hydroxybenzoate transporter-like MFS transporter
VERIVRQIDPGLGHLPTIPTESEQEPPNGSVRMLFTREHASGTLLLWVTFFMNLLVLYFILSWVPALLRQLGHPVEAGVQVIAAYSIGGMIGTLFEGSVMKRVGAHALLAAEFALVAVLIGALGAIASSWLGLMATMVVLGICTQGAQAGLNALAAHFYPTSIRATGVGWSLGVGRIGSILGPTFGGMLLALGWTPHRILMAAIAPAVVALLAVVLVATKGHGRSWR